MRLQFAEYTHSHVFFSYKKDNIDIDKKIIYISIISGLKREFKKDTTCELKAKAR